jgi:hypothetical protein
MPKAKKKDQVDYFMLEISATKGLPCPVKEHKFHPVRKWRFDYAIPFMKLAFECEGGAWVNGRHTRGKGFIGDMEKYNEAQLLGWKVYRFTPGQAKKGEAFKLFERAVNENIG